jgi:hypothetical protein
MGPWKGFWNVPGFTWRMKAKVDFGGNAAAEVSGWNPADIGWTSDGRHGGRVSREDAKARRKGRRRFSVSSPYPKLCSYPRRLVAMRMPWSAPA